MRQIKVWDKSLLTACLIGSVVGGIPAGIIYRTTAGEWNPILRVGIYFAIVGMSILLFGLVSELMTGNLRGGRWSVKEAMSGIFIALGATIVLFGLGALFQFLYGLGAQKNTLKYVEDYIILIDNSGSTDGTDPDEERFSSVVDLAGNLEAKQNVMVKIFDDIVEGTFPMTPAGPQTKQDLEAFFSGYDNGGGTDIQAALTSALDDYTAVGRNAAVLLLSDGESSVDIDQIARDFNVRNIPIYSIGFSKSGFSGSNLLSKISSATDGYYCEISELSNLTQTVNQILQLANQRVLLDRRKASDMKNSFAAALRVLFITVLGCFTGVAIAFALDNAKLLRLSLLCQGFASLAAGLLVEAGFRRGFADSILRLSMCLLFGIVPVTYKKVTNEEKKKAGKNGKRDSGNHSAKNAAIGSDLAEGKKAPEEKNSLV